MLFWDVGIEPDDAKVEDVDCETDVGVLTDFVPGLLHAWRPVDIVENDDGIFVSFALEKLVVVDSSLVLMVGIDEGKIDLWNLLDELWQCVVDVALYKVDIVDV